MPIPSQGAQRDEILSKMRTGSGVHSHDTGREKALLKRAWWKSGCHRFHLHGLRRYLSSAHGEDGWAPTSLALISDLRSSSFQSLWIRSVTRRQSSSATVMRTEPILQAGRFLRDRRPRSGRWRSATGSTTKEGRWRRGPYVLDFGRRPRWNSSRPVHGSPVQCG